MDKSTDSRRLSKKEDRSAEQILTDMEEEMSRTIWYLKHNFTELALKRCEKMARWLCTRNAHDKSAP